LGWYGGSRAQHPWDLWLATTQADVTGRAGQTRAQQRARICSGRPRICSGRPRKAPRPRPRAGARGTLAAGGWTEQAGARAGRAGAHLFSGEASGQRTELHQCCFVGSRRGLEADTLTDTAVGIVSGMRGGAAVEHGAGRDRPKRQCRTPAALGCQSLHLRFCLTPGGLFA